MIKNKLIKFLSILLLLSGLVPLSGNVLASKDLKSIPSQDFEKSITVDKQEFVSDITKNDFKFTGIASKWSTGFDQASIFLKTGKDENNLGAWIQVNPENGKDNNDWIYAEIFNCDKDGYFQYKIDFGNGDIGKNFKINFNLFDTSTQVGATTISADTAGLGPKIISRSEWGANESYMTWKSEYAEVKAFVIHHTAGEEGALAAYQMSVVRNLYYGHAVSFGWGDIGYNYVIDVNGNIYEGRKGGGGVIAGHTLGYNPGTIGIVLIGDYNVRVMSEAQMSALSDLIAYKSFQYGINPTGQVFLKDKTIPTIVGHKDLNATLCPGTTIYERLQDLRGKSSDKLKAYPAKQTGAQFVSVDNGKQIYGGDDSSVNLSLKNTGNIPWPSLGTGKLSIDSVGGKLTSSISDFGRSIEPGETGNFTLNVSAPAINETISQGFETRLGGNVVTGGEFNSNFNIITPDYRGKVVGKSADQALVAGSQTTLWVDIKNIGLQSWSSSDGMELSTNNGRESIFYTDGDWETKKIPGDLDNPNVSPGATGRISFLVTAPTTAGQYNEKFVIHSSNKTLEGGDVLNVEWNITVSSSGGQLVSTTTTTTTDPKIYSSKISAYTFSIVNQSSYLTLNPGEKKNVFLEIKNTGITNWYKDVFHLATIGDKESVFADSSWASKNRIAMNQDKVAPGDIARFEFTVTAPQTAGLYKERFGLVAEGIGWAPDIGLFWNFTVNSASSSSSATTNSNQSTSTSSLDDFAYVNQSPYLTMNSGDSQTVWLEVKNTGNQVWQRSGGTPVRLATNNSRDRISPFINTNRVLMDKDTVNPGEDVRFTFNITAPSEAKVYKEYFTLVRDGVAWFKDIGIYWQVTVNSKVAQQDTNQTSSSNSNSTLVNIPAGTQTVRVSSNGPFIVVNSAESKIAEGNNGDTITAFYKDGKNYYSINGGALKEATGWTRIVPWAPQTILTVDSYADHPAWNQSLNDNKFKGAIEVRYSTKNHKLWIIDDLNIEDYLAGVSEPLEAGPYEYIKAAVVAERSYVYNYIQSGGRWPDDGFTLKNSRLGNGDDQVYQGYGFTSRSTNIPKAVSDTAGQVVTYSGKPVITPYFTQDDGRTRSITEAWGSSQSSYPWLVSVSDPWCAGSAMLGHGVGMSGKGSRGMANDGKKYDEILKYFYTNTSVGKIDTNRNVRVGIYSIDM